MKEHLVERANRFLAEDEGMADIAQMPVPEIEDQTGEEDVLSMITDAGYDVDAEFDLYSAVPGEDPKVPEITQIASAESLGDVVAQLPEEDWFIVYTGNEPNAKQSVAFKIVDDVTVNPVKKGKTNFPGTKGSGQNIKKATTDNMSVMGQIASTLADKD